MRGRETRWRRLRDLSLYIAIGVLFVAAAWIYAGHELEIGGSGELPLGWLGFSGMTAIVFGYTVRSCRQSWKSPRLWVLLACFLIVHCGVGMAVLLRVARVPLLLFAILGAVEFEILAVYLNFFMRSARR